MPLSFFDEKKKQKSGHLLTFSYLLLGDLPSGTCGVFFIEALSAFPNST
jgi:hypothetical protein